MKRKVKVLTLTKETLRSLDLGNLSDVAGGVTATCPPCTAACTLGTIRCSDCDTCYPCIG